jgi:hypothetical protein
MRCFFIKLVPVAFDYKYYQAVRKITEINVFRYHISPVAYANIIPELLEKEDYESVKAIKEVLIKWLIRYGEYCSEEEIKSLCLFD